VSWNQAWEQTQIFDKYTEPPTTTNRADNVITRLAAQQSTTRRISTDSTECLSAEVGDFISSFLGVHTATNKENQYKAWWKANRLCGGNQTRYNAIYYSIYTSPQHSPLILLLYTYFSVGCQSEFVFIERNSSCILNLIKLSARR
jgi:hypothetical protein